jgi:hypothetical protein
MNPNPSDTPPTKSPVSRFCGTTIPFAIAIAVGAALTISNGPAVGISIGAALALLSLVIRRR